MNYPVVTAGLVMGPRGIGTMAAMMIVGRLVGRVDTRLLLAIGLGLTAWSMYEMTGWTPDVSQTTIIVNGLIAGRGSRLSLRAAEHGDLGDAAAAISGPKAPGSTTSRATSAATPPASETRLDVRARGQLRGELPAARVHLGKVNGGELAGSPSGSCRRR